MNNNPEPSRDQENQSPISFRLRQRLRLFKNSRGKAVKLSNFKRHVLREFLKAINKIASSFYEDKSHGVYDENCYINSLWLPLANVYMLDPDFFRTLCVPRLHPELRVLEFRQPFYEAFFRDSRVKEAYLAFISIYTRVDDCDKLSTVFQVRCCTTAPHQIECKVRWRALIQCLCLNDLVE